VSTLILNNLQSNQANGVIGVSSGNIVYSPGSMVQIQSTTKTDTFSAAPNGTWTDITGMTVTITPRRTASRIWLVMSVVGAGSSTTPKVRLLRNIPTANTVIAVGDAAGSRQQATLGSYLMKDGNQNDTYTQNFLDSPSTTSAITYKLQINNDNTQTWFLNRSVNDQDNATGGRYISVITAIEIAQ
jgi:hypothetical protein